MTRAGRAVALALSLSMTATPALAQRRDECVAAFDRAQALRAQGQLRAARASFVICASDSCPAPLRKDCAQGLSAIDTDLPTVVLGARDAAGHDIVPSAVYVDDELVPAADGRATTYDPGQHVIRFEHPPDAPVTEHVILRVGEHNREILATFQASPPAAAPPTPTASAPTSPEAPVAPPPEKHSTRPTGWILALTGIGALGIGSFAYFAATGYSAKQQLEGSCAPACNDDDVNRVRYRYIAADASLGVGLIALGIAAYLLFSSSSDSTASLDPQRFARIFWK
jgi:hypothetical protein